MFRMVRVCSVVVSAAVLCCGCTDKEGSQPEVRSGVTGWHSSETLSLLYYYYEDDEATRGPEHSNGDIELRVVVFYKGLLTSGGTSGPGSFSVSGPDVSVTLNYKNGDHFWIGKDGSARRVSPLPARVYTAIQSSKAAGTFDDEAFERCRNYKETRDFLLRLVDRTEEAPEGEGPSK